MAVLNQDLEDELAERLRDIFIPGTECKTNPELLEENRMLRTTIAQAQTLLWRDSVKTGIGLTGLARFVLERALGICPRLPDPIPNEKTSNERQYQRDFSPLAEPRDGEDAPVPTWSEERSP